MKNYLVSWKILQDAFIIVEAENEEEAIKKVKNGDITPDEKEAFNFSNSYDDKDSYYAEEEEE